MSIITYTVYNTTTGQIVLNGVAEDEEQAALQPGQDEDIDLDEADPATEYYPSGVKTTRPLFTAANSWSKTTFTANGTDSAVFGSSLPNPTHITIIGPSGVPNVYEETNTDTSLTIKATVKGEYEITIRGFPYQDYTTTLTAE